MGKAIDDAVTYSLKTLHHTKREGKEKKKHPDIQRHHVHVCIVCGAVIKGTEPISCMTKYQLKNHKSCIGVVSYRKYHGTLHAELERQYCVEGLEGIMLSPRSRCDNPAGLPV